MSAIVQATPLRRPAPASTDAPSKKAKISKEIPWIVPQALSMESVELAVDPEEARNQFTDMMKKPCGTCEGCVTRLAHKETWDVTTAVANHARKMQEIKYECSRKIHTGFVSKKQYNLYIITKWCEMMDSAILKNSAKTRKEAEEMLKKGDALLGQMKEERTSQLKMIDGLIAEHTRLKAIEVEDLTNCETGMIHHIEKTIRAMHVICAEINTLIDRYRAAANSVWDVCQGVSSTSVSTAATTQTENK
uniref:Uncharacterized protein n=1 Tax=viral metagenome TaxID=1070528 RepID=A0A6C0KTT2_9ZZZZ